MNVFGQLVFMLIETGIIIGAVSAVVLVGIGWLIFRFWEERNGKN